MNLRIRHCMSVLFRSISFFPYFLFVVLARQLNAICCLTASIRMQEALEACAPGDQKPFPLVLSFTRRSAVFAVIYNVEPSSPHAQLAVGTPVSKVPSSVPS